MKAETLASWEAYLFFLASVLFKTTSYVRFTVSLWAVFIIS